MTAEDEAEASAGGVVRVWDAPTRLTHWLVALLIPFSWWSASHDHLPWHRMSGYVILGLLVFRLYWGFAGGESARFSHFLRGPAAIVAYLRALGDPNKPARLGHNPLGGWSVAAMLAVLVVQLGLGLFSVDIDEIEAGPLERFVSSDQGHFISSIHYWTFWVLVGLIVLHLAAIAFYFLRHRDNLVGPMLSGRRRLQRPVHAALTFVPAWRILPGVALAAAVSWFIAHGLKF